MATELSIVLKASAAIGGAMTALKTLTGGLEGVKRSSHILGNEHKGLRDEINKLGSTTGAAKLQRQYDKLGGTIKGLRKNAVVQSNIQTKLENKAQAREEMKGQIMGLVGTGMSIAAPIKLAMDFESSMADVKKVVDFGDDPVIAQKQFKALSDEILHLSTIRPMSANDIAQIVALGGQSGIARGELMKFADDAVKMGVAFDVSAQQAGQSMAEMRTAFGMNQTQVVELADQINHLGNNTPAAAKGIMEIVQRVGAFGEVAGSSAGAIAAVGATIRGMGVQEEVAATGIKNMFLALGKGENATKSQKAAWKKLGMDHEQVAKDMQTNAEETTLKVLESISKLEKHEQGQVLESLFGSESLLAIAPLLSQLDTLKGNLDKVSDSTQYAGSMNKEYEARAQTTANNLQTFKGHVFALGITIGSVVLPALNDLMTGIKPVIAQFTAWAEANPALVGAIFKTIAAIFAFKVGALGVGFVFNALSTVVLSTAGIVTKFAGSIRIVSTAIKLVRVGKAVSALRLFGLSARQARMAIKLFSGGFGLIKSIIGGVGQFILKAGGLIAKASVIMGKAFMGIARVAMVAGKAMLTNPIVLVGLLIAGVAYLIWRNWDTIKPMLMAFWDSISQAASSAWQMLVDAWQGFSDWFSGLWNGLVSFAVGLWDGIVQAAMGAWQGLTGIWNGLSTWFGGLWQGISSWAVSAWQGIVQAAMGAWQWLVSLWSGTVGFFAGLWQSVSAVVMSAWTGITGFIGSVWARIKALVVAGVQGLMAAIRSFSPVSAFSTAFSAVWGFLSGIVGRFRTFGVNIIQGLIGGIKSMAGAVAGAISGVVGNVASRAKSMLGINSPSRLFRQFGAWVSEGLAIGINKDGQKPVSAIGRVAKGVTAGFGEKMGDLSAVVSTTTSAHQARMAGVGNAVNGNITIHYQPTIQADGQNRHGIEQMLKLSQREFEKMFHKMMQDRQRRAY